MLICVFHETKCHVAEVEIQNISTLLLYLLFPEIEIHKQ